MITIGEDESLLNYAQPIVNELRANRVRVDSDFSAEPFKAKISNAEHEESYPPPHAVGYGSSSAVATWKPAQTAVIETRYSQGDGRRPVLSRGWIACIFSARC